MHTATHGDGDISFATIEQAVRRGALQLACEILETALNADHCDATGSTCECPRSGGVTRYRGRRAKTHLTTLGEMTITRAYYLCDQCNSGFCPRDHTLGMSRDSLSPGLTRMVGMTASMVSFAESDELLRELAGIAVGAKMVERAAESLGEAIRIDEHGENPGGEACHDMDRGPPRPSRNPGSRSGIGQL